MLSNLVLLLRNKCNFVETFLEYFDRTKRPVFEPKEKVQIVGVGSYIAKVDTGNDAYCVLHGEDIRISGDRVFFKTDKNISIERPLLDTITINVGAGNEEKRPIVSFDMIIKGKPYKDVKFSIGDRKTNDEKVLLGLKFLEQIKPIVTIK